MSSRTKSESSFQPYANAACIIGLTGTSNAGNYLAPAGRDLAGAFFCPDLDALATIHAMAAEKRSFASLQFPDRKTLRVEEVAKVLQITDRHVVSLIEEGKLDAFDCGGGKRRHWRIPVEALQAFLEKRHSLVVCGYK